MRRWLRRGRYALAGVALALALAPAVYIGLSFALLLAPVNRDWQPADGAVRAYVASNGIHADLVLPVQVAGHDWRRVFAPEHFRAGVERARYVAIGWGDREFYLHTPTWADLTVARALRALGGGNPSLVHVTYLRSPAGLRDAASMPLTKDGYARLVTFVEATLRLERGVPLAVPGAAYSHSDAFFEAQGSYGLLNTCNAWVGRALRAAGVRVSRWTPFDAQAMWYLPAANGEIRR